MGHRVRYNGHRTTNHLTFDSKDSEGILQCELEYAGITYGCDFPEQRVAQSCCRIIRIHMIGNVKGFASQFYRMTLSEPECSRESQINSNASRTQDIVHAHIAPLSVRGLRKSSPVDPLIDGLLC